MWVLSGCFPGKFLCTSLSFVLTPPFLRGLVSHFHLDDGFSNPSSQLQVISVYFRFLAVKPMILVRSVTFVLCRSGSFQTLKKLLLTLIAFHKLSEYFRGYPHLE